MTELTEAALRLIHSNQHLAYLLVAAMAFSESLPVAGSVIPGTTIIMAISALVPSGAIHIWPLLGAAVVGAILGDGFSYWLGHHYHREIVRIWPLSRYPQILALGEQAFVKHGGKSVFIARFAPAIRAIVPMVAGITRMDPWRFYAVNILSALAWAPAHILPAVLAGASLALFGAVAGRLLVLVLILLVLLWLIYVVVRYLLRRGLPWGNRMLFKAWSWANRHEGWFGRELLAFLDPRHPEAKALPLLALVLVVGLWTIFAVLRDVWGGNPLSLADSATHNFLQGLHTHWSDQAMVVVTELGDSTVTFSVAVVVGLWLVVQRAWRSALYWLGAVAVACCFVLLLPAMQQLPAWSALQPGLALSTLPSSHTAIDLTVYGFLALIVGRELGPRGQLALVMATALLVALIAFARLYLGAHWSTDVASGVGFGLAWIAGLGIAYLAHRPQRIHARGLLLAASLAFIVAGSFHASASYSRDLHRYVVPPTTLHMDADVWWQEGWHALPARRIDLGGGLEEPLTLQWAGPVEGIAARLTAQGWQQPPSLTLQSLLNWIANAADTSTIPVLNRLHDGHPAKLILIFPEPDHPRYRSRLILRVWRANVVLGADGKEYPLWVGAVVQQRLYRVASLFTLGLAYRDLDAPRPLVVHSFAPARLVYRQTGAARFGWDGWLLLAHDPSVPLPVPPAETAPSPP
jgi:membrane protein DedA with SNARE-associated domain/membrane-associated phospholipid phosphatase